MQSGKSPGKDGFYKTFSVKVAPLLLSMFHESVDTGILPQTLREGQISVLRKTKIHFVAAPIGPFLCLTWM